MMNLNRNILMCSVLLYNYATQQQELKLSTAKVLCCTNQSSP